VKCYIWSLGLYDAETLAFWKADQKWLEILKCGVGDQLDQSCEKLTSIT
jgi:hypothetical protein